MGVVVGVWDTLEIIANSESPLAVHNCKLATWKDGMSLYHPTWTRQCTTNKQRTVVLFQVVSNLNSPAPREMPSSCSLGLASGLIDNNQGPKSKRLFILLSSRSYLQFFRSWSRVQLFQRRNVFSIFLQKGSGATWRVTSVQRDLLVLCNSATSNNCCAHFTVPRIGVTTISNFRCNLSATTWGEQEREKMDLSWIPVFEEDAVHRDDTHATCGGKKSQSVASRKKIYPLGVSFHVLDSCHSMRLKERHQNRKERRNRSTLGGRIRRQEGPSPCEAPPATWTEFHLWNKKTRLEKQRGNKTGFKISSCHNFDSWRVNKTCFNRKLIFFKGLHKNRRVHPGRVSDKRIHLRNLPNLRNDEYFWNEEENLAHHKKTNMLRKYGVESTH